MKAFKFPLDKVLGWRHLQMRAEEDRLAALQFYMESLIQRVNALASAELNSKLGLLKMTVVSGSDLQALTAYQARVKRQRAVLEAEKAQCEKRIAMQRTKLLKARRDFRILEKLKERRLEAWRYLNNREIENAAADAHNAKLIRSQS